MGEVEGEGGREGGEKDSTKVTEGDLTTPIPPPLSSPLVLSLLSSSSSSSFFFFFDVVRLPFFRSPL